MHIGPIPLQGHGIGVDGRPEVFRVDVPVHWVRSLVGIRCVVGTVGYFTGLEQSISEVVVGGTDGGAIL